MSVVQTLRSQDSAAPTPSRAVPARAAGETSTPSAVTTVTTSTCAAPPMAHRGHAWGVPTENTLGAFRWAASKGAPWFETDIRWTKDGAAVAMHDRSLRRTTDRWGYVDRRTAAYVKGARTPDGQHPPYLTQVLRVARETGTNVSLEMKPYATAAQVDLLVRRIRQFDMTERVLVTAWGRHNIVMVEKRAPAIRTGHYDSPGRWGDMVARGVPWDYYIPGYASITASRIRTAHRHGIRIVAPSAVHDDSSGSLEDQWQKLNVWGADMILTNRAPRYLWWAGERTMC